METETTSEVQPEEEGLPRSISQKERDALPESDFAWPEEEKYPITDQAHLDSAAKLLGHAPEDKQASIKERIISIAHKKGLTLPASWEDDKADRVADVESVVETPAPVIERDPEAAYKALTSQPVPERKPVMPEHAHLYAPITRIDDAKREVEGVATSEAVDSYGTIFSYEASKQAFQRWIDRTANVREMHDRKAVGKGIGVQFDDANKQVIVRLRVSKGANDTWAKVQEGVLSGLSVGAGKPYTWGEIERNGRKYPYLTAYELTELSLVDNASNPDSHGLAVCRAEGLSDLIDIEPEETVQPEVEQTTTASSVAVVSPSLSTPDLERAGARLSADSRASLHTMRDQAMQLCGCDDCVAMGTTANGNDDGDGDNDNDNDIAERMERYLAPALQRIHLIAGQLSRSNASYTSIFDAIQAKLDTIETAFTSGLERVAMNSEIERVLSELSAVKVDVERIAAQPAPGGPVLNGVRPAEKHLATDPRQSYTQPRQAMTMEILDQLHEEGIFDTVEKQTRAAAIALQLQQGRR